MSMYPTPPRVSTKRAPNFAEVKAVACGLWLIILIAFGIAQTYLTGKHGPCPVCGCKDRFRCDNIGGHGTWWCNNCGAGDGFQLLRIVKGWTAGETLRAVAEYLNFGSIDAAMLARKAPKIATKSNAPLVIDEEAKRAMLALWLATIAIALGNPVDIYLRKTRRLEMEAYPHCLRYHPEVPYYDGGKASASTVG